MADFICRRLSVLTRLRGRAGVMPGAGMMMPSTSSERRMSRGRRSAALTVLWGSQLSALALPTTGLACAVCVGSSVEDYGYYWGVLFLMAMPFTVGGVIGGWLIYAYRRSRRLATKPSTQNFKPPAADRAS
jgi:hypothetical protein